MTTALADDAVLPSRPLLLDACVVLSLYASGRFQDILASLEATAIVTETVVGEALYVPTLVDGERLLERIDLSPARLAGVLTVTDFVSDEEAATFIDLAVDLDDGEAASAAIAIHRGWRLATDDRKAIRLVADRVEIVGTLDIICAWVRGQGIDDGAVRVMFERIKDRRYTPAADHPHRVWWDHLVGS